MNDLSRRMPLVTVVIPCFNHGKYLADAIESVLNQTYTKIEIIVIDDGSTDDTKLVAGRYNEVKYVFQNNSGLSAARNAGALYSSGEYLVFLDADDLLYPYSIAYNVKHLQKNAAAAFVSGAYQATTLEQVKLGEKKEVILSEHYTFFLKSNYIGMHGTVMYQKRVFDEFKFDTSLKACEDYDMYLKVSRKYPVIHHSKKLAMYRMHQQNMSADAVLMLETGLKVLNRQKMLLKTDAEVIALKEGIKAYKLYYGNRLFMALKLNEAVLPVEALEVLRKHNLKLFYRYQIVQTLMRIFRLSVLQRLVPAFGLRLLYRLGIYKSYRPAAGTVKTGDFFRTTPFSNVFGYDRGGPIDRYYIENFLSAESEYICGRVLEIGDNEYTLRFGKENVQQSEVLHVNDSNPVATIVGDLSDAPQIADNSFDCIILTQTLHMVYDYKAVIKTCYRILKPGGTLLLTVPGITPIDYGEWGKTWLWSFTGRVMEMILAESFLKKQLEIETYGNVYVASAFLYGMGLPEIEKKVLDFHDPNMQVIITAKAVKAE